MNDHLSTSSVATRMPLVSHGPTSSMAIVMDANAKCSKTEVVQRVGDMNHEQPPSLMATRIETTHGSSSPMTTGNKDGDRAFVCPYPPYISTLCVTCLLQPTYSFHVVHLCVLCM